MTNLLSYINEQSKGYGTPDHLMKDDITVIARFNDKGSMPFVVNKDTEKIYWGDNGTNHEALLIKYEGKDGLPFFVWNLYNPYGKDVENVGKEYEKFNSGRVWNKKGTLYIAWWKPLRKDFSGLSDMVISDFCKKNNISVPEQYEAINDNGDLIDVQYNSGKTIIVKQSDERREELRQAQIIHLANQQEKRKAFELFRRTRDEKNGKKLGKMTMAQYKSLIQQESKESTLLNYINEVEGTGTPDRIITDDFTIRFDTYCVRPYPFVVDTKSGEMWWGGMCKTHSDMLRHTISKEDHTKYNIPYNVFELYNQDNPDDVPLKYLFANCGRVWCVGDTIYVAWWKTLDKDFSRLTRQVVEYAKDKYYSDGDYKIHDDYFYAINDNGVLIKMDFDDSKQIIIKQSDKRKQELQIAKAIHLASQEEKRKAFELFRKNRDEKNQKELYNHTQSKTEAEYRSIKYQESKMKPLRNYLVENNPDGIDLPNGDFLSPASDIANPFIIRYTTNDWKLWWGEEGEYHSDLIDEMPEDDVIKYDIMNGSLIGNTYTGKERMNSGRIWYDGDTIWIAIWDEFKKGKFSDYCRFIVSDYVKKFDIKNFNGSFYALDLNTEEMIEINDKTQVDIKQSDASKETMKQARIIHLASQKEKKDFFKWFKKNRDEQNQAKYNKEENNKSKTQAEHNYRNRGTVSDGHGHEHPYDGDSYHTNIKPLIEYLNEKSI